MSFQPSEPTLRKINVVSEKRNIHISRKVEYSPLEKIRIFTSQEKLNIHLSRKAEYSPLKKRRIFASQEKLNIHLSRKEEYPPLKKSGIFSSGGGKSGLALLKIIKSTKAKYIIFNIRVPSVVL